MKSNQDHINSLDRKLINFTQERLDKLEKFYDRIISADVYLKLENSSDKENKTAEVKINVPGDEFIVKKTAKLFEEALDLAAESLERVVKKHKEKQRAHV